MFEGEAEAFGRVWQGGIDVIVEEIENAVEERGIQLEIVEVGHDPMLEYIDHT